MKRIGGFLLAAALMLCSTACVSDGRISAPSVSSSPLISSTTPLTTATTTTTTEPATTQTTISVPTTASPVPTVTVGNVPFIDQTKDYPTGCESVSAVMVLQYWQYSISVDTFIDSYLPCGDLPRKSGDTRIGCDPYKAFPGDPRSTKGYGCFAPVITTAVQSVLGEEHLVADLTGTSLDVLCRTYIDNGIPVILWATAGMQKTYPSIVWQTPEGNTIRWISPNHCLVLTGYNDTHYFFNDPQKGVNVPYDRAACETAFNALGKQAVVIDEKPVPTTLAPITVTTDVTLPLPTTQPTDATTTESSDEATTTTESTASEETASPTTTTVEDSATTAIP